MLERQDPIARHRRYIRDDGATADSLWSLAEAGMQLDDDGVAMAFGLKPFERTTCVRGIRIADASILHGEPGDLRRVLEEAVRELVTAKDVCIALSGGVDSALIVALIRALDLPMPELVTIRTGWSDYDEVDAACAVADTFGARCSVVDVHPGDYERVLPHVIEAVAQPLYNLHPVTRWLLASHLNGRTLVTGDGADQVLNGAPAAIYIPLVQAICDACEVRLESPFFASAVAFLPPDPGKRALRELAAQLGVPASVAFARKTPKLTPHDADTIRTTTLALFTQRLGLC